MTDETCSCIGAKEAISLALTNQPQPVCALHDTPGGASAIALNDNAALAARLGATLTNGEL